MVSIIIPSRNEIYLQRTIENVLANAEGEIEVLVMLDGYVPEPPIDTKDSRVIFCHYPESIGQRQCVNAGARLAKGKYIMKIDAHCAVDKGFDVKLAQDCEYDWTVIPRMYNLDFKTWKPKLIENTDLAIRSRKLHDYMYVGINEKNELRTLYYPDKENYELHKRTELIDDTMSNMGCCFFMHKDRYWELGGLDENHGSWGQVGVEISCKAWLSGGSQKVNKKTWFAHWFRGDVGWPYPISGNAVDNARRYSQDLWLNDKWPLAKRKFQWMIDKFSPPSWNFDLTILYYTANVIAKGIEYSVLRSLRRCGYPIVSVSQEAMELGKNIVVPRERSLTNIYRQVLIGAKEAKTEFVALCEDDCLYVPEHFKYRPKKPFAYNLNRWMLHLDIPEPIFSYRKRPILSQCIAHRQTLIECLEKGDRDREMGREDGYEFETFETKEPNLVFCHDKNTSGLKYVGKDAEPKKELAPWGTVDYWVDKFRKRQRWSR